MGAKMFKDLIYILTYRCNKKCDFCYNRIFEKICSNEFLEEKNIDRLIEFLSNNKIKRISISGGEPAVREDLLEIIQKIHEFSDVKIFTNGLLFKKYNPDLLYEVGIRKIVYTITRENILNFKKFKSVLQLIDDARKFGIIVDGNAFLTNHYFSDKEKIILNDIRNHFDNVRWQPLVYPKDNPNFKCTVYGMNALLREKIFDDIINDNWGDISSYYIEFKRLFASKHQRKPCVFPHNVLTVNPDLSVSVCPHIKTNKYDFNTISAAILNCSFTDCLKPECLGIYSF